MMPEKKDREKYEKKVKKLLTILEFTRFFKIKNENQHKKIESLHHYML